MKIGRLEIKFNWEKKETLKEQVENIIEEVDFTHIFNRIKILETQIAEITMSSTQAHNKIKTLEKNQELTTKILQSLTNGNK